MWNMRCFSYRKVYYIKERKNLESQFDDELQSEICHLRDHLLKMRQLLRRPDSKLTKNSDITQGTNSTRRV
jgi:hypothetical protein